VISMLPSPTTRPPIRAASSCSVASIRFVSRRYVPGVGEAFSVMLSAFSTSLVMSTPP